MSRILIVDDDRYMRGSLVDAIEGHGHEVVAADCGEKGVAALKEHSFDAAITDMKMPGMSGLEFLEHAHVSDPKLPVIVITAHATVETAVDAMKRGAFDYILKPFGSEELLILVDRALEHGRLLGEHQALKGELRNQSAERPLIGKGAAIQDVWTQIEAVANSDATVLVRGETGTGKELVSRAVHYASDRAERPYLCVNCAALSAGLLESELFGHEKGAFTGAERDRVGRFELADGGTLLLDEVSEIEPNLQAKLLRVLQEKEIERVGCSKTRRVDVRVIATTNRDLEQEVKDGRFRQDLYFRLNIVPIQVPALRDRKEDILLLAEHFQSRFERRSGRPHRRLSDSSRKGLLSYHWPGNVRELENLIERAVLLSTGDELEVGGLDGAEAVATASSADAQPFRGLSLEEVERLIVEDAYAANDCNQKRTAESLGIGVRTLRDKMKKWGIRSSKGETKREAVQL